MLQALMLYLHHKAEPKNRNFAVVMDMLRCERLCEGSNEPSFLDGMFAKLEQKDPNHIAVRQYKIYKSGATKTMQSILISLGVRLSAFNLGSIERMTSDDEMELSKMGERKTALFCCVPDSDPSFNFIVGMLYTLAFQELYYMADRVYEGGRLPIHVHCIFDEFANIALPDDFESLLSTMRSREISSSIIIQNIAQIKKLYKDSWENITGNCDSFLFLGGNEHGTFKYISELLGRRTVDTTTYAHSKGRQGQYTTNYQAVGRELITIDEMRMIDKGDALLLLRGERPIIDRKFNLEKHKNIRFTPDGSSPAYVHGRAEAKKTEEKETNHAKNTQPAAPKTSTEDHRRETPPAQQPESPPDAPQPVPEEKPIPPQDITIDLGRIEDYEFYNFEEYLSEHEEVGGN